MRLDLLNLKVNLKPRCMFSTIFKPLAIVTLFVISTSFSTSEKKTGINIGDVAPELAYESPDGKIIKLSLTKAEKLFNQSFSRKTGNAVYWMEFLYSH